MDEALKAALDGFPRTRGDRPMSPSRSSSTARVPPHTRDRPETTEEWLAFRTVPPHTRG